MGKEKIQPVRGMQDILPKEMRRHRKVTETAREVAQLYGFEHMATPIMESVEVFKRTLGDSSDVVNKEMYTFPDRKGRELVLRPENTASIVRAFISNGLQQSLPAKFFYSGAMFRYERPQMGRQRQFHQVGVEALGTNNSSTADVDIIACAYQFLEKLGMGDKVKLQINTLGDSESRENYQKALVDYLMEYEEELSEDSQARLKNNPLRILDSKDEQDKEIIADAPRLESSLNSNSSTLFENVLSTLNRLEIKYEINNYLVRGLDYYCHTVFEFITDDLGAQNTVLAGGRYDNLVKTLGGHDIDGIGWAAGIERLASMLDEPETDVAQIVLLPIDQWSTSSIAKLAYRIRKHEICTDYLYSGNFKKRMQHASNINSQFALIINHFTFKLMDIKNVKEYDFPFSEGIPTELQHIDWMPKLEKALEEFFDD